MAVDSGARSVLAGDGAYARMREAIVTGRYRPNERLVETDLAEHFSVSRTPIREALHQLAADGLVVAARHGWTVREHDAAEVRQIYEVRMAMEGFAARLAAERGEPSALDRVAAVHQQYGAALVDASPAEQVRLNEEFHGTVVDACGNDRLRRLIARNREYYFDYKIARLYSREEMAGGVSEHAGLVEALAGRDGDAAERLTREHFRHGLAIILDRLF
jgi:DNA-binding GntR family transcriptional regulator